MTNASYDATSEAITPGRVRRGDEFIHLDFLRWARLRQLMAARRREVTTWTRTPRWNRENA